MTVSRGASGAIRPGGRTARTRAHVLEAVLAELVDGGYANLTMDGIARRSGVHRTTLYRRWGDVNTQLAEAATSAMDSAVPIPDTGALDDDLLALAKLIADNLRQPATRALVHTLAAELDRSPWARELAESFWNHRAELTKPLVDRAVERGELPEGTCARTLLETLIAPLYLRLLVTGGPLDQPTLRAAADQAALAARSQRPREAPPVPEP
jgi:AcrR family transcriptional regulator